jgi:O-antigen biosynthesis protein
MSIYSRSIRSLIWKLRSLTVNFGKRNIAASQLMLHQPGFAGPSIAELGNKADRLRDARRYQEAAEAYRQLLEQEPSRTDIRVQYGNMLKDVGRLAEAEESYRAALIEAPNSSDTHLQLGHVLKLQGRHVAAIDAYRKALELAPHATDSIRELAELGYRPAQEALFDAQLRFGGIEAIATLVQHLSELRDRLDSLLDALPNIQAQATVPVSRYNAFRQIYDVPMPPTSSGNRRFAVLLFADLEELALLRVQIVAVRGQLYQNWLLIIFGSDPARQRVAQEAAAGDRRICWISIRGNEHTSSAERHVALTANADWLLLLAPQTKLHAHAIAWFAAVAERTSAVAFVCDEDSVLTRGGVEHHYAPQLRQVVDYDTLLEKNVFGETIAIERDTYSRFSNDFSGTLSMGRSLLLLTLAEACKVGHIPYMLVSRYGHGNTDGAAHDKAVQAHLQFLHRSEHVVIGARVEPYQHAAVRWRAPDPTTPIAVIMPTRDNGEDLERAVASFRDKASAPGQLQFVIVNNGSRQTETLAALDRIGKDAGAEVIDIDEPFNWSRLNNQAVQHSKAPLLLFANDDMTMLSEDWDDHLRGLLARPEVGGVGARLLYLDNTVQHAGVLFGWRGSVIHDGLYEDSLTAGPASRWHVTRAVSAVTGAFLATRRRDFLDHGGFDEVELPVAFSDIDYALKLRCSRLKIIWTPLITLYHFESKTRGLDHLDPERRARNAVETAVMERRWGTALILDPGVNPTWHQATLPFRLLSPPSSSRLWKHIERCASVEPWSLV